MASPELARPLPSLCPWQSEAQSGRSSPDPGFCFSFFKIIDYFHPLIQVFSYFFKIIDNDLRSQVVEDTLGKHSKLLKLNRPRLLFRHLKGDMNVSFVKEYLFKILFLVLALVLLQILWWSPSVPL